MSTYSNTLSFWLLSSIFLTHFASAASTPDYYYPSKPSDEKIVHHTRKFVMDLMGSNKVEGVEQEKPKYEIEMRNVPAGPDPLHHNNGPQKRPRISP